MKVERVEVEDNTPFVTITLTRKEAEILKELIRYDINGYRTSYSETLHLPQDANEVFAFPLFNKLKSLGV